MSVARVTSRDGTEIAYSTTGEGPPLLLVHGTGGARARFDVLLPHLEPHATVHVMDRRGRGGSGDASDYALAREFEDIASVVDSIAEASGSTVAVYGHSYGGNCAWGAAALTSNIRALVLYEGWPPVKPELAQFPQETEAELDRLVAAGERDAALEFFLRKIVELSEGDIAAIRADPTWSARAAVVHTVTRENRAVLEHPFDLGEAAAIAVPVLVLTGAESPAEIKDDPEAVAAAIPDATLVAIEGQQHVADVLAPEVFAGHVLAFLRSLPR
jgi:pimeloyl-ACP methyl ester carboxylesterase